LTNGLFIYVLKTRTFFEIPILSPYMSIITKKECSTLVWWQTWLAYLLNCLRRDNGGDGATLLHYHTLWMTRVHLLPMQVVGRWLSVCLYTITNNSMPLHATC